MIVRSRSYPSARNMVNIAGIAGGLELAEQLGWDEIVAADA